MARVPRILAFAGSSRRESLNKKLVRRAVAGAKAAGAEVTLIDLADYPLPLFDQDLEARDGAPGSAIELKELFKRHDALLIASPEYNSSVTALLKNTIDWVSRPAKGEQPLECFAGKSALLIAASPGALGGLRGLVHLRAILGNIQVLVLPDQRAVAAAHEAFAPDGTLADAKLDQQIQALGAKLAQVTAKLVG